MTDIKRKLPDAVGDIVSNFIFTEILKFYRMFSFEEHDVRNESIHEKENVHWRTKLLSLLEDTLHTKKRYRRVRDSNRFFN